jgi:hypothetical protein
MSNLSKVRTLSCLFVTLLLATAVWAQSRQPYPAAKTDRRIRPETPMAPPLVNAPFRDPDFGSPMVRATDETTNFKIPGSYLRNEASGQGNIWSSDTSKFYVIGQGGYEFAFHFNPSTMKISSLPGASPGKGLVLPLRTGSSFSFTDPDLIYGTRPNAPTYDHQLSFLHRCIYPRN